METIKNFFTSFTFFVGFMITCIFIQMMLGGKVLEKFLWLVLFGMIVTNGGTFISKLQRMKTNSTQFNTISPDTQMSSSGVIHGGSSGKF